MSVLPDTCRVVVVGAGLAGLTLARELALAGVGKVVVLEAGPDRDVRHKNTLPGELGMRMWHMAVPDPYFVRDWTSRLPPHYDRGSGIRRRFGGRSLYWHGVCLPIEDEVLQDGTWPRTVVDALVGDGRPGLYAELQARLARWTGRPLDACRGPVEEQLLRSLRKQGYAAVRPVPLADRPDPVSGGRTPYTPVEHWTDPRGETPPAVFPECEVLEVCEARNGRALVKFRSGARHGELRADRVFLAAGTMAVTRLAGHAISRQAGRDECELVGLNDHIVQGFLAEVPRRMLNLPNRDGRAMCFVPRNAGSASNLFVDVSEGSEPDRVLLTVWAMGEQENSKTAVRLGRSGGPAFDVDVRFSERDHLVISGQTGRLGELAARLLDIPDACDVLDGIDFLAGLPAYLGARTKATVHRGREIRLFPYAYPLGSVDHEGGTLALGSLTDEYGALRCLPAVHVSGPALFPRSGVANPSLTTMALATWQARQTALSL
ncbi:oxidoreductase [Streptomyces sannanensis]|uniref:Oxidoreductase n=1 Tax=Streptomyces sannanensis TaxID=285536 RepID=A0ABP6SBL2_9ACTN